MKFKRLVPTQEIKEKQNKRLHTFVLPRVEELLSDVQNGFVQVRVRDGVVAKAGVYLEENYEYKEDISTGQENMVIRHRIEFNNP